MKKKKFIGKIILLLLLIITSSFDKINGQQSNPHIVSDNCDGVNLGDFEIFSHKKAAKLANNYNKRFADNDIYTRAIYFDSSLFIFLRHFFESNLNYSGIQIYFSISEKGNQSAGQYNKKQFNVFIAPSDLNGKPDFEVLKKFYENSPIIKEKFSAVRINNSVICPGICDEKLFNKYDATVPGLQQLTDKLPIGNHQVLFNTINTVLLETINYRSVHDSKEKSKKRKRHTQIIFFSRCTIDRISSFLINRNRGLPKFPAIGMYPLVYKKKVNKNLVKHQSSKFQYSLGFVPLVSINDKLKPDLCEYVNFLKTNYKASFPICPDRDSPSTKKSGKRPRLLVDGAADNHGTLCPNGCPPGGN